MKRLTLAVLLLGLGYGCSQRVITDHAREADFSSYETFQYTDTDYNIADTSDASHRTIVTAIRREMSGAGLREVGDNSDLNVTYYGEENVNISLNPNNFGYSYGSGWRWGGRGGATGSSIRFYNRGTLVVDIWDATENLLVWRGVAPSTISADPEASLQVIERSIAEMFERFPPDR